MFYFTAITINYSNLLSMYKCLMHHKYSISLKLPKSTQHRFDQITVLLCPQITVQKFVDIQYRELTEKHLSIMDCRL